MAARDIRTVIPLPRHARPDLLTQPDLVQTWLLHLPADYYLPLPLRVLKPGALQRLLLDPQAGVRLDHGAAVREGGEWCYLYRITFGASASIFSRHLSPQIRSSSREARLTRHLQAC
jgi:hypothetical protein